MDLTDCYQYEDNQTDDPDAFAREPYILHFKPRNTGERAGLGWPDSCLSSGQTLSPHLSGSVGRSHV